MGAVVTAGFPLREDKENPLLSRCAKTTPLDIGCSGSILTGSHGGGFIPGGTKSFHEKLPPTNTVHPFKFRLVVRCSIVTDAVEFNATPQWLLNPNLKSPRGNRNRGKVPTTVFPDVMPDLIPQVAAR